MCVDEAPDSVPKQATSYFKLGRPDSAAPGTDTSLQDPCVQRALTTLDLAGMSAFDPLADLHIAL